MAAKGTDAGLRWRVVKSVLALPGTVLVLVPALVLYAAHRIGDDPRPASVRSLRFWVAAGLGAVGLVFGVWSMSLFAGRGHGTPAPWDPPEQLVVRGPYRYVRNPMITGVLFMLAAEAAFLRSRGLAVWLGVFFAGNSIYFPLVEERGLEERFGADYRVYAQNVPRWLPRTSAWEPD